MAVDTKTIHENVQRVYRALGKLMQQLEDDLNQDAERQRVTAEYNRVSEQYNRVTAVEEAKPVVDAPTDPSNERVQTKTK
jgi:glutamate-1-semialdehyde aminotransferase